MKKTFLFTCIVLFLSSCNTYKYGKYSRPQIETESIFGSDITREDTISIASIPWRQLFTDPDLQKLIATGLTNNSDLKIAALRVKEAEASLRASRQAILPSVAAVPQGQLSSFDGGSVAKTYSIAVSAQWELDIAKRLTYGKEAAMATLQMNHAYRQAVQTQLVATIANSYYNLLTLDEQLKISRRTLDNWQETIRTLKAHKEVGESDESAVSQAKANKLVVEGNVLTLSQQIKEQENSLSSLIGTTLHAIERSNLASQSFPEELSTGIPARLLDNRPDIRQAEYALQNAFYNVKIARTAFYP